MLFLVRPKLTRLQLLTMFCFFLQLEEELTVEPEDEEEEEEEEDAEEEEDDEMVGSDEL